MPGKHHEMVVTANGQRLLNTILSPKSSHLSLEPQRTHPYTLAVRLSPEIRVGKALCVYLSS